MSLHEEMSRKLAGDLTPDQAAALERRIAAEPEARAAWEGMNALVTDLSRLPSELPVPADLVERALDRATTRTPSSWSRHAGWVVAVAAVALGMLVTSAPRQPELVLLEGEQWVAGDVLVHAGDAKVTVDGAARISVEPAASGSRVPRRPNPEGAMRKELIAGVTGAIVTVTVYEGRAWVETPDAGMALVEAGDTRSVGQPAAAPSLTGSPAVPGETPQAQVARLERELAATRQQLAEAKFVGAIAQGQVAAHQGQAVPWPASLPAPFQAERFAQELAQRLASNPQATVESVDCSEYPCLAVIQSTSGTPDWAEGLEASIRGMVEDSYGDKGSVSLSRLRMADDERESKYVVFGAWDGAEADSDALRQRTSFRMEGIHEELNAGSAGDPSP